MGFVLLAVKTAVPFYGIGFYETALIAVLSIMLPIAVKRRKKHGPKKTAGLNAFLVLLSVLLILILFGLLVYLLSTGRFLLAALTFLLLFAIPFYWLFKKS